MIDLSSLMQDLQQRREEMQVQFNLAGKEAEQEWDELMDEWHKFMSQAQFDKSADEVGEAARELGLRMKAAYDRLRNT